MKRKLIATSLMAVCMTVLMSVTALANTLDVPSLIGTGFTNVVSEVTAVIGVIVPPAIGVIGVVIAVRWGINFFRSILR